MENIEKKNVVQKLVAQIVYIGTGNNFGKLKVCPVLSDFKRISSIQISIYNTQCVSLYACSPGPLRQNYSVTLSKLTLVAKPVKLS